MKLLLLPLAALAFPSPAPDSEPKPPVVIPQIGNPAPQCDEDVIHLADRRETVKPQRLGELPTARMEHAVWYQEDGCTVPVVVKENIGR